LATDRRKARFVPTSGTATTVCSTGRGVGAIGTIWRILDPIQNPNLWPDMRSTYFIGRLAMPAGSSLTLRGSFPYARFFQIALYRFERHTFVAIGESLRGPDIEPDSESTNPFRPRNETSPSTLSPRIRHKTRLAGPGTHCTSAEAATILKQCSASTCQTRTVTARAGDRRILRQPRKRDFRLTTRPLPTGRSCRPNK
jgi:hypothetical protein